MATEENQTQVVAAVLARRASPPSTGSRSSREARHANNCQEAQRYADQLWHSKERSSPPLLFYRKLSCDSGKGTILDEEYDCLDCASKILNTEEKLYPEPSAGKSIEGIANPVTPIPGESSEGSPCQLDTSGEGVDTGRNRTGSTRCSCTMSSLYVSPNIYCCHTPRSSPGSVHSPRLSSSPSQPTRRHVRRSSLPVSMLAFHKVIESEVVHAFCICLTATSVLWYVLLKCLRRNNLLCFLPLDISLPLISVQPIQRTGLFGVISL